VLATTRSHAQSTPVAPSPIVTAVDYARAEQLLPWNTSRLTFGDEVAPQFFKDGNRFWYHKSAPVGLVVINPPPRALLPTTLNGAVMIWRSLTYDPDVALPGLPVRQR
jgi:hypothetical protein